MACQTRLLACKQLLICSLHHLELLHLKGISSTRVLNLLQEKVAGFLHSNIFPILLLITWLQSAVQPASSCRWTLQVNALVNLGPCNVHLCYWYDARDHVQEVLFQAILGEKLQASIYNAFR